VNKKTHAGVGMRLAYAKMMPKISYARTMPSSVGMRLAYAKMMPKISYARTMPSSVGMRLARDRKSHAMIELYSF